MFQHLRLKEFPASGGVNVLAEAEPIDAELATAAVKLLLAIEWALAAMVEFRRDDVNKS